ncbi:MAG: hypothetical protein RLZZ444_1522 [Pseudomonadota bacterium]|jgi:DNA-binding IclR family transcriptional regulator
MREDGKVPGAASARKILSVILSYTVDKPLWSVAELSETLDVSMPTMYRYVALLREMGLLEPAGVNLYRLSERMIGLARAAQKSRSSLEEVSMPVMERIRDLVNETVLVARRNGDHVYCVERVESRQPVRLQFERGQPMSLHKGSLARVLLANMPKTEQARYLASVAPTLSEKSAELLSEQSLAAVLQAGYTQSFEEVDEGIWGTAAAIRVDGKVVAALGVAAPIYRLDTRHRELIIENVRAGATEISRRMGGEFD